MEYLLQNVSPGTPLRFFEEISAIPRASGNEAGIAAYLMDFAAQRGLFACCDAARNVLIKKPATKGREHEDALLLQAHTDMVAEKAAGVSHDFAREGVHLVREGDILRADGTTLGADDGFGVSMILGILAECEDHPALECLFTASEETGMDGANAFDYSQLSAKTLLNLDGAEEDLIVCGCSGGLRSDLHLPLTPTSDAAKGLRITLSGLCGGHSGEDIHKGRANALTLMAELLCEVKMLGGMRFSALHGGDKSNAIPRECVAVIAVSDVARAVEILRDKEREIKARFCTEDRDFALGIESVEATALYALTDTDPILHLLSTKGGVLEWHKEIKGLPYTSRNVAKVVLDGKECLIGMSHRSFDFGRIEQSADEVQERAERVGGHARHSSPYPAWDGPARSPLIERWQMACEAVTGARPRVSALHAGLECGIFAENIKGLSAISLGCNIKDLHAPTEQMELSSFDRIYRVLLQFLKKI